MVLTQWGNILAHGQGLDRGVFTIDVDSGDSLEWESKSSGKTLKIPNETISEVCWRTVPSGCKLTLILGAGAVALFTGFKLRDREVLAKYFAARCAGKELTQTPLSTKGQNLGTLDTLRNELQLLDRDKEEVLSISLSRVKNCAVPVHNEMEVQCDTDDIRGDQELCDMIRFFIPPDVDGIPNAEELCDDVKAVTNATTGDVIFEFDSKVGTFLTPRGKFAIEMYRERLRLHGTTYDFNIDYANIQKIYLLPDPKSPSHFLVMCLKEGLQQGRQSYKFLVLKLKEEVQLVQSYLKQDELDELYGTQYIEEEKRNESNLQERTEDLIYKIVAKCFFYVAKVKIYQTSDYVSSQNFKAVMAAVGNQDGMLFPLTKGLMFLHKPAMLIPYKSIHEASFLRLDSKNLLHTFDLEMIWVNSQGAKVVTTFKNISKDESTNLQQFLRRKKVTWMAKRGDGPDMVNTAILDEQLGLESDDNSEDDEAFTEADARAQEQHESSEDSESFQDEDFDESDEDAPRKKRSKKSKRKKKSSKHRGR